MINKCNLERLTDSEEIKVETEYGIESFITDLFKGNLGNVKNRTYRKLMDKAEEKNASTIEIIKYGNFMSGTAWETHAGFSLTAKLYK